MTRSSNNNNFTSPWAKLNSTLFNKTKSPKSRAFLYGATTIAFVASLDFVAPTKLYSSNEDNDNNNNGFRTYWTDTCQEKQINRQTLTKPLSSSDVVIIGGGMAGLHTALSLAEKSSLNNDKNKLDISILEANTIGGSTAASGLSKGLVVSGIQVPQEDLQQRYGEAIASKIYDLSYKAEELLKQRIERYGIQCRLEEGGGLVEASIHGPDGNDDVAVDCATIEDEDDDCEDLNAAQVHSLLGTNPKLYKCGEYDKSCAGVDPLGLTRGLARACESGGTKIYEHSKAVEISKNTQKESDTNKKKFRVKTSNGSFIDCNHVVICSGAESISPNLSKRLSNSIVPVYTYMGVTEPLSEKECPIPPIQATENNMKAIRRPMGGDDYVCLNYWRVTQPDEDKENKVQILFGSLADSYPIPLWLAKYRLQKAFVQVYPQCSNVKFDCVWGGTLAFGRRAVPLIGRDEEYQDDNDTNSGSVWYATGFGGHGIVPTAMAGSIVADAIIGNGGDDETWRMFQETFPPEHMFWPFGRLGTQVVLCLYNVVDWAHVKGMPVVKVPKPW